MIFMGLLMFTGRMNAVTGYLSSSRPSHPSRAAKERERVEIKLRP